jgi:hypothetical protein
MSRYRNEIKPFSISDMAQDQNTPSAKPSNNEYLQPLAIASGAAIFGFGYSYYYGGDVTRALTVGGLAFLVLFWIVLRGNNRKKQRESKPSPPILTDTDEALRRDGFWGVVVAGAILLGFAIALYFTVSDAIDRRAKANRVLQAEQDDKVVRVRKIQLIFWRELSNPNQVLADRIDEAAAALKIPIHSIEKNWPGGPIVVTYEGTAKDAYKIQDAIRWVGVPTHTYQFVK